MAKHTYKPCCLFPYPILAYLTGCVLSHFSHVWLFATPWAVAHQAPLSMGFSRQEYWSELPRPPDAGIEFLAQGLNPHPSVSCVGRRVLYHWCHLQALYLTAVSIIPLKLLFQVIKDFPAPKRCGQFSVLNSLGPSLSLGITVTLSFLGHLRTPVLFPLTYWLLLINLSVFFLFCLTSDAEEPDSVLNSLLFHVLIPRIILSFPCGHRYYHMLHSQIHISRLFLDLSVWSQETNV